jgi:hypothetical protein
LAEREKIEKTTEKAKNLLTGAGLLMEGTSAGSTDFSEYELPNAG